MHARLDKDQDKPLSDGAFTAACHRIVVRCRKIRYRSPVRKPLLSLSVEKAREFGLKDVVTIDEDRSGQSSEAPKEVAYIDIN